MPEEREKEVIPSKGGVFNDLSNYIKLVARLIGDKRVGPLYKLLPIGALAYFLVPDLVPGPIDDAMVVWLGTYLFVEICPADVVQEHRDELDKAVAGEPRDSNEPEEDQIVDAEFWEKEKPDIETD